MPAGNGEPASQVAGRRSEPAALGPLLAAGREADVYALDGHRVLRRYRNGTDAAAEAAAMTHVGRYGFPVPVVYEVAGADLVLERVAGPTLLQALVNARTDPAAAGAVLADLHTRLHALPPGRSPDPAPGPASGQHHYGRRWSGLDRLAQCDHRPARP